MAKDPAFLFYSQDFFVGCVGMSDEEVGRYMRIICIMHQKGRMTQESINQFGEITPLLKDKFKVDNSGLWYNDRLEKETEKRSQYSDSRRNNAKRKKVKKEIETRVIPDDETDDDKGDYKTPQVGFKPPTLTEVEEFFTSNGYKKATAHRAFNYYNSGDWHNGEGRKLFNWKQAMIANWFKEENKINHNGHKQHGAGSARSSANIERKDDFGTN